MSLAVFLACHNYNTLAHGKASYWQIFFKSGQLTTPLKTSASFIAQKIASVIESENYVIFSEKMCFSAKNWRSFVANLRKSICIVTKWSQEFVEEFRDCSKFTGKFMVLSVLPTSAKEPTTKRKHVLRTLIADHGRNERTVMPTTICYTKSYRI